MSAQKHTHVRLAVESFAHWFEVVDEETLAITVARLSGSKAEANAQRLVACWNACEAMQDPEVEVAALRKDSEYLMASERLRAQAIEQRDELLAELMVARSVLSDFAGLTEPHAHSLARRFAEDIAKVKGGGA